jgi:hypothetical protein
MPSFWCYNYQMQQTANRNCEIVQRYKAREKISHIASDVGISRSRTWQIIASHLRGKDKEYWYDDKLPTMLRNSILNALWEIHKQPIKLWDLPEREAADIVANLGLQRLRSAPNIGRRSLARIERWLSSLEIELK